MNKKNDLKLDKTPLPVTVDRTLKAMQHITMAQLPDDQRSDAIEGYNALLSLQRKMLRAGEVRA